MQLRSRAMPPLEHAAAGQCDLRRRGHVAGDRTGSRGARPARSRPSRRTCIGSTGLSTPTRFATCSASRSTLPSMLPPDTQAHGFDTNADALAIEPALLDRYLTAAAKIARLAVGDPTMRPAFERYTAVKGNSNEQTWLWQTERLGEAFSLGSRGGIAARHYFPLDGEYDLQSPAAADVCRRDPRPEHARRDRDSRGWRARGTVHDRWSEPPPRSGDRRFSGAADPSDEADEILQVRVPLKAGLRRSSRRSSSPRASRPKGWDRRAMPDLEPRRRRAERRALDLVAADRRAVQRSRAAGFAQPPQHLRRVSPASPTRRDGVRDEDSVHAGAARVSAAGHGRRRPDAARLLSDVRRADGGFDTGIRAALERLLVSPDFLFRIEADPGDVAPGTAYRLSDVELASRLSFFLWSSIPDDELLDLAIRGKLRERGRPRAAGAAHARRSASARRAGGQLLRPVAADAQRLAADARLRTRSFPGSTTTCGPPSSARRSCSSTIS